MTKHFDSPQYQGKVVCLAEHTVYGWAWDRKRPEQKLVLEILLDDYPVNLCIANVFNDTFGPVGVKRSSHAFFSQIPLQLLEMSQRLSVRVANTDFYLAGEISLHESLLSKNKKTLPVESLLIYNGGLKIGGYYLDHQETDKKPKICVYEDQRLILRKKLKTQRQGHYDIDIHLPLALADGKKHILKLTDHHGRELRGSPISVLVYPQGARALLELLKQDSDSQNEYHLLDQLLLKYLDYLPDSSGFEMYPQWFEMYQAKAGSVVISKRSVFCLIIYGEGDWQRSLDSIRAVDQITLKIIVLNTKKTRKFHHRWGHNLYFSDDSFDLLDFIHTHQIDYLSIIEAGDRITENALPVIVKTFQQTKASIIYSDHDYDDKKGGRTNPWFKPDWDYEMFLSQNYIQSMFAVSCKLMIKVVKKWGKETFTKTRSFHLFSLYCIDALQQGEQLTGECKKIVHIPRILYHKQFLPEDNTDPGLTQLSSRIIQQIAHHNDPGCRLVRHPESKRLRRFVYPLATKPVVSIIIPTRDKYKLLKKCINSLKKYTTYPNYEVIIVNNRSVKEKTLNYFNKLKKIKNLRILDYPGIFNYSAINNFAVKKAKGELIALVNNDIEFQSANWLEEMVSLLLRENVAVVGCKLTWPNGMVQHGGVILGINGLADHAFNQLHKKQPGYFSRAQITQQYSAVTAACLLTRRSDYESVHGLDEEAFPVAFNDVDYCLKLRARGKKIIWTPYVDIVHAESASRGKDKLPEQVARASMEMTNLKRKWSYELMHDPFYNPNLALDHLSGPFNALAIPPRVLSSQ